MVSANEARLVSVAGDFLSELKDLTPGKALEAKLNRDYGPGNPLYDEMAALAQTGLKEGWLCNVEVGGPKYRRARLRAPCEELRWFSITGVYMESEEGEEQYITGDYHAHPYGEINMVIPIKGDKPEIEGLDNFWMSAGWTCPGPGSHHYPRVRNGGLVALFFLPAGRIAYNAKEGDPQPNDIGRAGGL